MDVDEAFTPRHHDSDNPLSDGTASCCHPFSEQATQQREFVTADGQRQQFSALEAAHSLRARVRSVPNMSGMLRTKVSVVTTGEEGSSTGVVQGELRQAQTQEPEAKARGQAGLDRTASADAVQSMALRLNLGSRAETPGQEAAGLGRPVSLAAVGAHELQQLREQVVEQFQTVAEELSMQRYMIHQVSAATGMGADTCYVDVGTRLPCK